MAWPRWMVCQASRWAAPYSVLLVRVPADGGRVEEHGGALQRGQPRALGIPLVPADQRADPAGPGVEGPEAQVARREVELLVEGRVVGDVHLAVEARRCRRRRRSRPRCCGRGRPPGARRPAPPPPRPPRGPRAPAPRCWGRASARPGRTAARPRAGRSRASGTARAGRRPGRRRPRPRARRATALARGSRRGRRTCASARGRRGNDRAWFRVYWHIARVTIPPRCAGSA